jgi:hypothetical protein
MVQQNNLLDEILSNTFSQLKDKNEFDDDLVAKLNKKITEMNQESKFDWKLLLNILKGEE